MSGKDRSTKDKMMASYMKQHPSSFPDSVMRAHNGCGRDDVVAANKLGTSWKSHPLSKWGQGVVVGGVLAARLGFADHTGLVPQDMVVWSEKKENYGHQRGDTLKPKIKVPHSTFRITLTGNASTELLSWFAKG